MIDLKTLDLVCEAQPFCDGANDGNILDMDTVYLAQPFVRLGDPLNIDDFVPWITIT